MFSKLRISNYSKKLLSMSRNDKNAWLFFFEGALGAVIMNLTNPFLSMFAKRLGGNDYHVGLITSLPALVGMLALVPGAFIVDRQRDKKRIVGLLIVLVGIIYPLAALTPFLGALSIPLYILFISLANWPLSVYNISFQSFFSDVFPQEYRNWAYAHRSKAVNLFAVVTVLTGGILLSYIPHSDSQRIMLYQLFFALVLVMSLFQMWFLSRVSGYSLPAEKPAILPLRSVPAIIGKLGANREFMGFTVIAFLFHITWQMGWPLFFIYQVDFLHANEAWLSYISVITNLAGVFTFSLFSRCIEKKGARFTIIIGALGLTLNPFLSVSSPTLYHLMLVSILTGLLFSAFQLGLFECLMEVVPKENKTLNIAFYTTFINLSGFMAPLLGVTLYKMTSIHTAMYTAAALRLGVTGLFYLRFRKSVKKQSSHSQANCNYQ